MNKESIIKTVEDFCEQYDYEFRDDYSGRFMYGALCIGIVCDYPLEVLVGLCQYLSDDGVEDFHEYLSGAKQDSMGLSSILYFPGLSK